MTQLATTNVPDGYNTVNPFIISDNAGELIRFIVDVFGGEESRDALTHDGDGLVLHSEVRVGNSTIMIAARKPEWRLTPAFLQVYVNDVKAVLKCAAARGATVITKPTEYIGVVFSRIQDPWRNIWWVYQQLDQYDWEAAFGDGESGEDSWQPTEEATYIHDTLMEAMKNLAQD
jgi:uncharacterized glyoxalase superfamily protein PhnB